MFRSHRSTCMPVSNWQLKLHMMITGLSLRQSCGLGFCSDKCTGWLIWLCGVTLWRFSLRVTGLRAGDLLFSICWLRFCVCLLCQLWFRLCFTCIFGSMAGGPCSVRIGVATARALGTATTLPTCGASKQTTAPLINTCKYPKIPQV